MRTQGFTHLYFTGEENARDQAEELRVRQILPQGSAIISSQRTLLAESDLPFSVANLPLIFTNFRKEVEAVWKVKAEVFLPDRQLKENTLLAYSHFDRDKSEIFHLENSFAFKEELAFGFRGGEEVALSRLKEYFLETNSIKTYKESRNGMLKKMILLNFRLGSRTDRSHLARFILSLKSMKTNLGRTSRLTG